VLFILPATAQTQDRQFSDLTVEVSQLKSQIADQEERIAQLEKTVKALQETSARTGNIAEAILKLEGAVKDLKAIPPPEPIPPMTAPWHSASNWKLVKEGMSRAQVVEVLGPPTRETSVIDTQTLYYGDSAASQLAGSVTLVGDRLTTMIPPAF
jgi:predicted S18 family serine protease